MPPITFSGEDGPPWEENFRERMRRKREAMGTTQTDLAKELRDRYRLPFHQQTVQRIESGERPIRLDEAHLIAEALGENLPLMTADVKSADHIRFKFAIAYENLAHRGRAIAEYIAEDQDEVEDLARDVFSAWEAYEESQESLGEAVDPDLLGDMRRFETRYERFQRAASDIADLGDL